MSLKVKRNVSARIKEVGQRKRNGVVVQGLKNCKAKIKTRKKVQGVSTSKTFKKEDRRNDGDGKVD